MATSGSDDLASFLDNLSLSSLTPTFAEEELTLELLQSMQGATFADDMAEIGVHAADAQLLAAALHQLSSEPVTGSSDKMRSLAPLPDDKSSYGERVPQASSAPGTPSVLEAALALARAPATALPRASHSQSTQAGQLAEAMPSAMDLIKTRSTGNAARALASTGALRMYQARHVDPATQAAIDEKAAEARRAAAEARWRNNHSNALSYNRNDI